MGLSTAAASDTAHVVVLPRHDNQALGIGTFAIDFLHHPEKFGEPSRESLEKTVLFHTDAVLCGVSALALKTNAPTVLRSEALEYRVTDGAKGATVFGSAERCAPEKAIAANCAAVREWDSNGTVFGYNADIPGHQAGEFGHNDFYPVVIAAAQQERSIDGKKAVRAMLLLDEIRGRLAEVFSLKTYKIDHVVHGAVASAAVYGALLGATAEQIEAAIGMTIAHYIPFRAIRAGKQLSDSKGASAALSTEVAIMSMRRAMKGFVGPKDIFRNPEAIFRWFEKQPDGNSPFNLRLSCAGDDFAVCGMHFKLGLYEHQSAGAIEGLLKLLLENPEIYQNPSSISEILIKAYEPAFGIIGDPAKRDPQTRQSADHSMVYIIATLLRKAVEKKQLPSSMNDLWKALILTPFDYNKEAIQHKKTRELMAKVQFAHGGAAFDEQYPLGIPTSIDVTMEGGKSFSTGMVMFPSGHAKNSTADLKGILDNKFAYLGEIGVGAENAKKFIDSLQNIEKASNEELQQLYSCSGLREHSPVDA